MIVAAGGNPHRRGPCCSNRAALLGSRGSLAGWLAPSHVPSHAFASRPSFELLAQLLVRDDARRVSGWSAESDALRGNGRAAELLARLATRRAKPDGGGVGGGAATLPYIAAAGRGGYACRGGHAIPTLGTTRHLSRRTSW